MPDQINISLPFIRSYAFIIGINKYRNGISQLKTAVKDAEDIALLLEKTHKYKVYKCLDATKQQMLDLFAKMKQIVGKDDRIFFYFAGHGIAFDSEKEPQGYLVPADAKSGKKDSLVSMDVLRDILNELPCQHGLIVLDCCFAGAFKWSTSFRSLLFDLTETLYAERFYRFVEHPAWQVITSSAHDQKAADILSDISLGMREGKITSQSQNFNSPFAKALKQAINLEGKADVVRGKRSDGVITASELYLYLREIVEKETYEDGKRQSPAIFTLGKHDTKGEFIFLHPGHRLNLPQAPERNPYKGLHPYSSEEEDEKTFFGRTKAMDEIAQKLTQTSLLIVSSPSGIGKSSVVKAGLFPLLKQKDDFEELLMLRPGDRIHKDWEKLPQLDLAKKQLLLIDQYEEMFVEDGKKSDKEWKSDWEIFEEHLIKLYKRIQAHEKAGKTSQVKIVLTLRSDFEWKLKSAAFGQCFWEEAQLRKFLYRLPPMTSAELRDAMVKPAWVVAYEFESEELIDRILEEINHAPGALPLLSFTLHKLYELRDKDRRLFTEHAYEKQLGGINGALSKHADDIYKGLPTPAHQDAMRKLMLRMVRLNDGSYTRRRVFLNESSRILTNKKLNELDYPDFQDEIVEDVLEELEKKQLVIRGKDELGHYIEPIHDSLINFWPRCLHWIQEMGRENLVLQRQLWQAVLEHHQWKPDSYSQPGATAPFWDNNPKLQQVQLAITDPKDEWFCQKGWGAKSISSLAYLLWTDDNLSPSQLEDMKAYHWFFEEDEAKKYYPEYADPSKIFQKISAQMDNWLNEAELIFIKKSFEKQQSEIERLTRERDEARATALAAKARQIYPQDNTIGLNLAYAAHRAWVNAETASALAYVLNEPNSQFYQRLEGHTDGVVAVAFSPAGKQMLSGSYDKTLRLWDTQSKKEIKRFKGHTERVLCAAFSPNAEEIISGSTDKTLRLWSVGSGKEIKCFEGHEREIKAVAFSPDGKQIISGSRDGTLRIWSCESGEEIQQFEGNTTALSLVFSPDGNHVLSGSYNHTPYLWSIESGDRVKSFKGHTEFAGAVAFSPDGKQMISGSRDTTIRLWSVASGKELKRFEGHTGEIKSLAFFPDGKQIISGSSDRTIRIWKISSGMEIKRFNGHTRYVVSVAISPDSKQMLSGSYDGTLRLWPIASGQYVKHFEKNTKEILSLAISPDGSQIISTSSDKTLRLWSTASGKQFKSFAGHTKKVTTVAFAPNDSMVASGSFDKTIRLWSTETGGEIKCLKGHTHFISSITFSPDGQYILSGAYDKTFRLWDVATGQEIQCSPKHGMKVISVAFSPDGTQIISGSSDKTLRLWSVETGKELRRFGDGDHYPLSVSFSPDGAYVATGADDHSLRLWSVESGIEIQRFEGHTHRIGSIVFLPNGKQILTGSQDHTIRLWSVDSGEEIHRFEAHTAAVNAVTFSPDGKQILSGASDGRMLLRRIVLEEWDEEVYKLNAEERKKYRVVVDY